MKQPPPPTRSTMLDQCTGIVLDGTGNEERLSTLGHDRTRLNHPEFFRRLTSLGRWSHVVRNELEVPARVA